MKTWQEYLEEAKHKINYEKAKEETKALSQSLQEKGFIEIVKEWETEYFPFIQISVKLPWDRKTAWDAINTYESVCSCTMQEVKDFIDGTENSDLIKNAFLLFAEDNIDKLAVVEVDIYKRLLLHLGKITDKDVYLILAEKWEPSSEIEEENL